MGFVKWFKEGMARGAAELAAREPENTISAPGAYQTVTAGSDAGQRVTATRLLTTGVFAFAIKKRTGHVYLETHDANGVLVDVEEHPAKHEADLRKRAAKFNRQHAGAGAR